MLLQSLLERGGGCGFFVEGGEEIEQADHFQGLNGELGGFEQADASPGLLGGSEMADQHADAAGIDSGDAFEVEDNFGVTVGEQFVHGGVEAVESGAHAQATFESDNFDGVQRSCVDIQLRNPLAAQE